MIEGIKIILERGCTVRHGLHHISFHDSSTGELMHNLCYPIKNSFLINSQIELLEKFNEINNIYSDMNGLFAFAGNMHIFGFTDQSKGFLSGQRMKPVEIMSPSRMRCKGWDPDSGVIIGTSNDETFFYNFIEDQYEIWSGDLLHKKIKSKVNFYKEICCMLEKFQDKFK